MNKHVILMGAAAALLLSCAREADFAEIQPGETITFTAGWADAETRTILQPDGTSVWWEPAAQVNMFFGDKASAKFTSSNGKPQAIVDFLGSLPISVGSVETENPPHAYWAVYPYNAANTCDGESVTLTVPATQTAAAGTFGNKMFPSIATSTNFYLAFYNVCGGVRFSLTTEGVKEVVFQGLNDEDIAGKVKLAFVDGVPAVQEVVNGQKSITLSAPYGTTFETGKWYYVVALPGTLSNGFKMTFSTETQYATLESSGSKTIKRGIFGSLADADEDLVYKDKEGGEPVTGNIVFADPAAKYACVAKFDTDGDGEVSIEEAEAATSFSGLFTNWKGVTSFDEIRYFKNVHSLSEVFQGCNKLVSIDVPESIDDLGSYAFDGCSSLESINLPSGISAIGNYTFQNCSSLVSVDIPLNVTSVGSYAFSGCSSLTSFELPSGVTSIADYTFQSCTSLVSVDIPSGVASIGQYAFSGCSSLNSIDFPSQLKSIGQYAFSSCSSLRQVVIPDGVTSLGYYAFSGCTTLSTANIPSSITAIPRGCFSSCRSLTSVTVPDGVTSVEYDAFSRVMMWKLELPSSIISLDSNCFGSIICIILPSTSPVTIQSNTFDGVKAIFVPSNLIDMYGGMTNWVNYASKLRPIESFKENTLATSGAVEMGTSVKWAAYNLGATSPEEYGDYYAWGETQTKSYFDWSTYKWCRGSSSSMTKYCTNPSYGYSGFTDDKTVLDPEDDAARVNWGGMWRMPTNEEWTELIEGCVWMLTKYEGTWGYKVICIDSGNSIFLPASGERVGTELRYVDIYGNYWSSSLKTDDPYYASYAGYVYFTPNTHIRMEYYRFYGYSIRPVCD